MHNLRWTMVFLEMSWFSTAHGGVCFIMTKGPWRSECCNFVITLVFWMLFPPDFRQAYAGAELLCIHKWSLSRKMGRGGREIQRKFCRCKCNCFDRLPHREQAQGLVRQHIYMYATARKFWIFLQRNSVGWGGSAPKVNCTQYSEMELVFWFCFGVEFVMSVLTMKPV